MRILYFCLIVLGLFFTASVSAQEGGGEAVVCPAPPSCDYFDKWDEYKCTSTCDASIQKRTCWIWQTLEVAPGGGECPAFYCATHNSCSKEGQYPESNWSKINACLGWQSCGPQGVLRNKSPECSCSGTCIEPPVKPRYYDNPGYTDRIDKDKGNTSLAPPIKFDWDDVEGWKAAPDGPKSYLFKLNTAKGNVLKVLDISEYAGLRKDQGACFLEANSDYSWQASACCSADGQNCGQPSNWNFHTGLAPELVSPDDPDWSGPQGGGNIIITPDEPLTVDWCDVREAKSYRLRVFLEEKGQRVCSSSLADPSEPEQCDSWVIKKERRDPGQTEKILYSDFTDEDLYFFTKDTNYDWEVKACLDETGGLSGGECKDYSQRWSFESGKQTFKRFSLLSPPNDREGKTPVGFPLALSWSAPPGMNSYYYQINNWPISLVQTPSEVLDTDVLKLNTVYKWKAKPCSDNVGLDCEDFSQEWYFKTTGQPPKLTYPSLGATDVTIPVNLRWEEVPGAKSYTITISGDGLSLTTTTDQPWLLIDYPTYPVRQETSYSWQVKTCAYEGWPCGDYSDPQNFKTFKLPAPLNPTPADNGSALTNERSVSWEAIPQAKAYQYQIKYANLSGAEKDPTCPATVGAEAIPLKKISSNSDFVRLKCLGQYQWQARACLDENCSQTSSWSAPWTFNLIEPAGGGRGGLVPCGKAVDDPKTTWNEREPCQLKHIALLIKTLIGFLLFKVIPLFLVLLAVYSGLIFYFSIGRADALAKIIALWKSVGIGLGITFFAWVIAEFMIKIIKMV